MLQGRHDSIKDCLKDLLDNEFASGSAVDDYSGEQSNPVVIIEASPSTNEVYILSSNSYVTSLFIFFRRKWQNLRNTPSPISFENGLSKILSFTNW